MHVRKILCPVDFSDPSREALHFAADLSRRYDAEVMLLHVYQVPGYAFPEGVVMAGPEALNELVHQIDESLAAWRAEAQARGASRVRAESAMGVPAAEILRIAREGEYDLIVIGTHGRTGLRHVLLGSVAEKVVRTAPCPVLTVRQSDHRFEEAPVLR